MRKHALTLSIVLAAAAVSVGALVYARGRVRPAAHPAAPAGQSSSQRYGSISGRVLDPGGNPVAGAHVEALGARQHFGKIPSADTDEQGRFLIERVRPETYNVAASKEEDGYASTGTQLYTLGAYQTPQVSVHDQQTTQDVLIRLLPRCAKLSVEVLDAKTQNRITRGAEVTLRRLDNPQVSLSGGLGESGEFSALAPDVPYTVEVSAPGYRKWQRGAVQPARRNGTTDAAAPAPKHITISLEREE